MRYMSHRIRAWRRRQRKTTKRRRRDPRQEKRYQTLRLLFRIKRNRRYSPGRTNRRRLAKWFDGGRWATKIRKLTDRQIRRAVDLNGNWNPRRLSWSAREALGYTYTRDNLTGRARMVKPTRPYVSGFRKVAQQKFEMRGKSRDICNKKTFGQNRLKELQRFAYKNAWMEEFRDSYPDIADRVSARGYPGWDKSARTLMAEARGGRGIRGRRAKKLVQEHGSWTIAGSRGQPSGYVMLDGKEYNNVYHIHKDGAVFTGTQPWNSSRWNQVLIPKSSYEQNIEIYREIYRKARHYDRRTGRRKRAGVPGAN